MDITRSNGGPEAREGRVARYGVRYEGHDIEVRVQDGDVDAERVEVAVDGDPVDGARTTRRSHDIAFDTDDGVEIRLHVGGRALDPLVRVRLRRPDGYWVDLRERPDAPGA